MLEIIHTRCISEYYCPWSGNKSKDDCVKKFNIWIRNKLIQKDIVSFLPYYEYFEYNNKNIIDYVLYFENIEKEFNNLFNKKLDRYDNQRQVKKKYDINLFYQIKRCKYFLFALFLPKCIYILF